MAEKTLNTDEVYYYVAGYMEAFALMESWVENGKQDPLPAVRLARMLDIAQRDVMVMLMVHRWLKSKRRNSGERNGFLPSANVATHVAACVLRSS